MALRNGKEYFPDIPKDSCVTLDYELQKTCKHDFEDQVVINFDRMWGDGDVVCKKCGKFIRTFDSG
jgi:hypothetical protein